MDEQRLNKLSDRIFSLIWLGTLGAVLLVLLNETWRNQFVILCGQYPYGAGFVKLMILGSMGDLLSGRIVRGYWPLEFIPILERAILWGIFGIVFTLAFPLFSDGTEGLIQRGLLPIPVGSRFWPAFWKSFLMQALFAFPFMTVHRFTDTLVERRLLLSRWPAAEILHQLDWQNLIKIVGFSIIWFWLPAHTANFMLPAQFRVIVAALLAVVLGLILGTAKRLARGGEITDA